jgi:23S rRNA (pseudouridine1915-N3)-methyltransferase
LKLRIISVTRKEESFYKESYLFYVKKLQHYCDTDLIVIRPPDENDNAKLKEKEAELILAKTKNCDFIILFDEKGKITDTKNLALLFQQRMNASTKQIALVIGGAYGFSDNIFKNADAMISLSSLTFPHQLAKLIVCEQCYRAFTILKGEKYHHG